MKRVQFNSKELPFTNTATSNARIKDLSSTMSHLVAGLYVGFAQPSRPRTAVRHARHAFAEPFYVETLQIFVLLPLPLAPQSYDLHHV